MDASEALLISNRNNRDDYGFGGGVFMWVIVLVLIFFSFGWGGNRWGNDYGYGYQKGIDTNELLNAINGQARTQEIFQTQRDILEGNSATQQAVYNTSCKTQNDVFTTACGTQKEILESRYTTQLGFQAAQAQLASCCCDLKSAIAADGEQTRALITANTIQDLRDRLSLANNALTSQTLAREIVNEVRPCPIPAYLSCSPYTSYGPYGNGGFGGCGGFGGFSGFGFNG